MPLGTEVGIGPGDFVLDGHLAPLPKKEASPPIFGPCLLWPNGWLDPDGTWRGGGLWSRPHCARWGPKKRAEPPQFSSHVYCGQTAICIRIPLGVEVGLMLSDIVLDGDPAPPPLRGAASNF